MVFQVLPGKQRSSTKVAPEERAQEIRSQASTKDILAQLTREETAKQCTLLRESAT